MSRRSFPRNFKRLPKVRAIDLTPGDVVGWPSGYITRVEAIEPVTDLSVLLVLVGTTHRIDTWQHRVEHATIRKTTTVALIGHADGGPADPFRTAMLTAAARYRFRRGHKPPPEYRTMSFEVA